MEGRGAVTYPPGQGFGGVGFFARVRRTRSQMFKESSPNPEMQCDLTFSLGHLGGEGGRDVPAWPGVCTARHPR